MPTDLYTIRVADKHTGDIESCPEAKHSPTIKSFLEQRRFLLRYIDLLEQRLDLVSRIEFPDTTGK